MRLMRGILLAVLLWAPLVVHASAADDEQFDSVGHTADGNYFDLTPFFGKIELPRLFLTRNANGDLGFDAFLTTKASLESGHYEAYTINDSTQVESVIADADLDAFLTEKQHLYAQVRPKGGEVVMDFSITRHLLFLLIGFALMCWIFLNLAGRYKKGVGRETAPKGLFHNLFEVLIEFIRDDIARPSLGKHTNRYLPYLLTVFFLILFCNFFGLLPMGVTATANVTVTATLAVFTFLITQFSGTKDYWGHIFKPPGTPAWLLPIMVPIEILGLFTKPFALAIRLFANMTAGHLVILNLVGLIFIFGGKFGDVVGLAVSPLSLGLAIFIYFIELLVAFIQAYIFTFLSALFIGMALEEHEHHDAHEQATT